MSAETVPSCVCRFALPSLYRRGAVGVLLRRDKAGGHRVAPRPYSRHLFAPVQPGEEIPEGLL